MNFIITITMRSRLARKGFGHVYFNIGRRIIVAIIAFDRIRRRRICCTAEARTCAGSGVIISAQHRRRVCVCMYVSSQNRVELAENNELRGRPYIIFAAMCVCVCVCWIKVVFLLKYSWFCGGGGYKRGTRRVICSPIQKHGPADAAAVAVL